MGGAIKSEGGSKLELRHVKVIGSDVAITATDSTVKIDDMHAEVKVVVEGENVDIDASRVTHIEPSTQPGNLSLAQSIWRHIHGYD